MRVCSVARVWLVVLLAVVLPARKKEMDGNADFNWRCELFRRKEHRDVHAVSKEQSMLSLENQSKENSAHLNLRNLYQWKEERSGGAII
jgi:hypothetical protein